MATAESLKDQAKAKFKELSQSFDKAPEKAIDPPSANDTTTASKGTSNHSPNASKANKALEMGQDFGKLFILGLGAYLLGYFSCSFILVLLPLVSFIIYKEQKLEKAEKGEFHKEMYSKGEEATLLARLGELPSWIHFPDVEKAHWVNSVLTQLWPHVSNAADRIIRQTLEPQIREVLDGYNLKGFRFQQIDLGRIPPRLSGIKVYDSTSDANEILLDLELEYFGDAMIAISLMKVPASIGEVQLEGRLRVVAKPLIGEVPLIGGLQVFFLEQPSINFDLGGAASILDLPGLNSLFKDAILEQIGQHMLLPNKISILLSEKVSPEELKLPDPPGVLSVQVIEGRGLLRTDRFGQIDPYIIFSQGVREKRTAIASGQNPGWNERLEFILEVPESEELDLMVFDKDSVTEDDFLGQARISAKAVTKSGGFLDTWLRLENVESGQVHLRLLWLPKAVTKPVRASTEHCVALLNVYLDSAKLPLEEECTFVKLKVDGDQAQSARISGSEPLYQEGFTLLLNSYIEDVTLTMEFYSADGGDKMIGEAKWPLKQFLTDSETGDQALDISLTRYDFGDGQGWVKWSARARYVSPMDHDASSSGFHLHQRATSHLREAARNVGSATKATTAAVRSLGSSTAGVIKRASPRVLKKTQAGPVLETNMDEEISLPKSALDLSERRVEQSESTAMTRSVSASLSKQF